MRGSAPPWPVATPFISCSSRLWVCSCAIYGNICYINRNGNEPKKKLTIIMPDAHSGGSLSPWPSLLTQGRTHLT